MALPLMLSSKLDDIAALLGKREAALAGWIHFLAFDLFFDPHHRDRGDGDQPVAEPDRVPKDPHSQPVRR